MKTSIFDMAFVLPPILEIGKEEKDMPFSTYLIGVKNMCDRIV